MLICREQINIPSVTWGHCQNKVNKWLIKLLWNSSCKKHWHYCCEKSKDLLIKTFFVLFLFNCSLFVFLTFFCFVLWLWLVIFQYSIIPIELARELYLLPLRCAIPLKDWLFTQTNTVKAFKKSLVVGSTSGTRLNRLEYSNLSANARKYVYLGMHYAHI